MHEYLPMTKIKSYETQKDHLRENLTKYTRKAFQMIPEFDNPRILDVGCGRGVPTMQLARLSEGQITGLDINQTFLDELKKKIKDAGLSNRVGTLKCSMLKMDFPDESFDIIWAEGSIWRIGFEKGLKEWGRFLKPNGFLVVHDEIANLAKKLKKIPSSGYKLLGHFIVSSDAWRLEYYGPLERLIQDVRAEHTDDPKALDLLDKDQREVEVFKTNPKMYGAVFFVMQKV